ncbi:MAG: fructose-1,6-bisphosphatase [Cellulosilyticaceae bacterium]
MCTLQKDSHLQLPLLKFLSNQYPTIDAASTEVINLKAILNLPKATEHFVTDIHGEYESFSHVLHNASGILKLKIDKLFQREMSAKSRRALAMLIYYPEKKIDRLEREAIELDEWYHINLLRIIRLSKQISAQYTRSKVRKALPKEFAYIMEELLNEQIDAPHKEKYYEEIIKTIIDLGKARDFLCAFCYLIQRLAVDHLHVIGDIFDRGPRADRVMNILMNYHSLDIQWGNHDILWMGAASGNEACIANVIRIGCRYDNLQTLEDGYGINLLPLATLALEYYSECNYELFIPKGVEKEKLENKLIARMHKAITIIQLKLEGKLIECYPEFKMKDRKLLHKIDWEKRQIILEGTTYDLKDTEFPTVDPSAPYELTAAEKHVVERLKYSFKHSSKLQQHVKYLFMKGSMYKVYNNNLLYHGCILMTDEGVLQEVPLSGKNYKGRAYLDELEKIVREGYFDKQNLENKHRGEAMMWYLWCGKYSPLFGKDRMTTFERYFIKDEIAHHEEKNAYYHYIEQDEIAIKLLESFGVVKGEGHIINGHVPVKIKKGESPIKAGGKVFMIDGGFTKAYQKVTGIAGYTLIYDAKSIKLASHKPFEGIENAIELETDIVTTMDVIEQMDETKKVADTDVGKEIKQQIEVLLRLIACYQSGVLKES